MRVDPPVVLHVTRDIPTAKIKILRSAVLHGCAVWKPKQKIGEFIRRLLLRRDLRGLAERDGGAGQLTVERENAARLRAGVAVEINTPQAASKGYSVFREYPC